EKLPLRPMLDGGFVTAVSIRSIPLTINVAVTDWAAFIVTTQLPIPVHPAPLQPVNADPLADVAVKVTCVPLANAALHVAPPSLQVTVPLPVPVLLTARVKLCICTANVAVTTVVAVMVTVQVLVPEQPPPLQPLNTDPLAGTAVKVTCVPLANEALHVAPQSMPAGLLLTAPPPLSAFHTDSVYTCEKLAFTDLAALMVT